MKVRVLLPFLTLMAAFAVAATALGDGAKPHDKAATASAGLERFKQLAGDWVGKMSDDGQKWLPASAKYAVTSGGSAVVETLGPGTPHEMVTVIHQDGNHLGLTHYCAIGNQPHMKAEVKGDGKVIEFEFTGASNMASDKDLHMHSVTFTFIDKDTLRSAWTSYQDGKKEGTAIFEFKRKKA
jgi:hypothetical protein